MKSTAKLEITIEEDGNILINVESEGLDTLEIMGLEKIFKKAYKILVASSKEENNEI